MVTAHTAAEYADWAEQRALWAERRAAQARRHAALAHENAERDVASGNERLERIHREEAAMHERAAVCQDGAAKRQRELGAKMRAAVPGLT